MRADPNEVAQLHGVCPCPRLSADGHPQDETRAPALFPFLSSARFFTRSALVE